MCHKFKTKQPPKSVFFLPFRTISCKSLASFALYYLTLKNKKASMHLAKDVVAVDYIKMPNMGHIAKGKPLV